MTNPIMQVRKSRKDILLILATAVLLAVGINFSTSYLSAVLSDQPLAVVSLSAVFLIAGFLLLKHIAFGGIVHIVRIRGAFAYRVNEEILEPIRIIGNSFNDDFCRFLRAFVHENRAYLKLLSTQDSSVVHMDRFDPDNLNHHTIINSVLEFTVLHKLALFLNSYFVENEIDRSGIVVFARDQLGHQVLRNRVIDQLTRDMKERPAFSGDFESETRGVVVSSYGTDGAVYQRLGIELPPNSKIARNNDGFVVIANPLFDLTILPNYRGFSTSLPRSLTPSLEGPHTPLRMASLKIIVRVRSTAFLTRGSMEMYEWLDALIEQLHDYMSTDRLTKRLDADLVKMLSPNVANPSRE